MRIDLPHNYDPRTYQLPLWNAVCHEGCKRAVAVWHRRAGKDLLCTNLAAVKAVQRVGLYWHILPTYEQGRKAIWNGATKDGRRFLDAFPDALVKRKRDDMMMLELTNGSIYQVVGAEDPDRLVGTNPVGLIFSEYSLQNPAAWDYLRPILLENGGWAVFIYTPRGHNHGYKLYQNAKRSDNWFHQLLTIDDTGVMTDADLEEERENGMTEELIRQEYYASFEAPMSGAYYAEQMNRAVEQGRITHVPWEERLPVTTMWDLGINDATAIWFAQILGKEVRLIDYEEASDRSLQDWIKLVKDKPYVYDRHLGPHDIEVREYTSGKSRLHRAQELGVSFDVVPKHSVADGIQEVRRLLGHCWFDETKCEQGIDALKAYRREYDEKLQNYRDRPVHDWASHAADAIRTGAMGLPEPRKGKMHLPDRAIGDYDPFMYSRELSLR